MRRFSRWPFLFSLAALLLVACAQAEPTAAPQFTTTPTPTPTPASQPPPTPQPIATPGSTSSPQPTATPPSTGPTATLIPTATPTPTPTPTPAPAPLTFASVNAGNFHTCGVTTGGAAYCWGQGGYGQMGDGSVKRIQTTPIAVSGGLMFASVSAGFDHTCGVTTSGVAYCWGQGRFGRLGNGTEDDQSAPVPLSGGLTFASVSAGRDHSCGVTTDGAAYCWGYGASGKLGDGIRPGHTQTTPLAVLGGLIFASVSAGFDHTCGVTTSVAAYCWGEGGSSQLGDKDETNQSPSTSTTPSLVSDGLTFASVSAGEQYTCGVPTDGGAFCWGQDRFGRLGNGTEGRRYRPTAVSGRLAFASVSASKSHTCGVTTSGAAYCWGGGDVGRLGNGAEDHQYRPVAVSGGLVFASVSVGGFHTCGVTIGGAAFCWGAGGRLGDGSLTGFQTTSVAVGPPAGGISTPTPQPTLNPTATQVPVPGDNFDNALAIELGEAASFSITSAESHYYEVQLEDGITYTIYVTLDTLESSFLAIADSNERVWITILRSRLLWSADSSGSHFVIVSSAGGPGSYTLTVLEGNVPRPPPMLQPTSTPIPTATPSAAPSPSAAAPPTAGETVPTAVWATARQTSTTSGRRGLSRAGSPSPR